MSSTSNSAGTDLPLIPAIVGPTAIGKTSIALELCDLFNLEIVSCDSRQIYKYLNIGAAKPTAAELGSRPYHLIDFVEPDEVFSAARYRDLAEKTMKQILNRGKRPLIVGGTGLYLKALTTGFFSTPPQNEELRRQLQELPAEELHRRLRAVDAVAADNIPPANKIRVIRALEIYETTGNSKSQLSVAGKYPRQEFRYALFGLSCYRQKLYQFVNLRVDKMIGDGLVAEVQDLSRRGYADSPVLRSTLGYREILAHLEGEFDLKTCIALIKQKTRNYAKRQITWFKRVPGLKEIDVLKGNPVANLSERLDKLNLDTSA